MAAPTGITLRAYDVGFGDCFLLSFKYGANARHLLVDFGSTRSPTGKSGTGPYLERIARQIAEDCDHKLTAVVVTHRHKDHLSGFAMNGNTGPGAIIRALQPEIVVQPWTEDPTVTPDAEGPPTSLRGPRLQRHLYLSSLADMNHYAGFVRTTARTLRGADLKAAREQLDFLGDDNELANRSAVLNLMTMGKRKPQYLHFGATCRLESLLPGVKVHVLGPPTLAQDPRVTRQTDTQADEFWHLRAAFWARRGAMARQGARAGKPLFPDALLDRVPWDARWYAYKAQRELADALLSIVRTLDDAMNNTSLNLLFEVGKTCLLFPGDAQWENWRYALEQPKVRMLLAKVNVYKVGHHGSLNATPKSMWQGLAHRGSPSRPNRLLSLLSTREGVHGSIGGDSEVPRGKLVTALRKDSTLLDTRDTPGADLRLTQELVVR